MSRWREVPYLVFTWSGRDFLVNARTPNLALVKAAQAICGRLVKNRVQWSPCGKKAMLAGLEFKRPMKMEVVC